MCARACAILSHSADSCKEQSTCFHWKISENCDSTGRREVCIVRTDSPECRKPVIDAVDYVCSLESDNIHKSTLFQVNDTREECYNVVGIGQGTA